MPITPPDISVKRQLARKMFDAGLSMLPGGGPLAALLSVMHPPKGDVDRQQWLKEVNSLEETVAVAFLENSIKLSEDASSLGKWIAEESKSGGRSDSFDFDVVIKAFPTATEIEMQEAVGELELEGLIETNGAVGKQIFFLKPTLKLFEIFDPIIFPDVAPREDAATIAKELLQPETEVFAEALAEKFGWSIRRLNPAMAIVADFIPEGCSRRLIGGPYIIKSMVGDATGRASLRKFVNDVSTENSSKKGAET